MRRPRKLGNQRIFQIPKTAAPIAPKAPSGVVYNGGNGGSGYPVRPRGATPARNGQAIQGCMSQAAGNFALGGMYPVSLLAVDNPKHVEIITCASP